MTYAKYELAKAGTVTKDGHTMFPQDIVKDLNRKSFLEAKIRDEPCSHNGERVLGQGGKDRQPTIERVCGDFPGEIDNIFINHKDFMIRIGVPRGHSAEDVDVRISFDDGWEEMKIKGG